MATFLAQIPSSGPEVDPSVGEEVILLEGSSLNVVQPNLDTEVRDMFREAWQCQVCSDIIICAGDIEFKAHKLVLAAHSSYFKEKLEESRVNVEIDPDVLKLVFSFLYDGKVGVPISSIGQLKEAVDFLKIPVLQNQCLSAALANQDVTEDNCLEMWMVGMQVKNEHGSTKGLAFALKNLQSLQYNPNFLSLPFGRIREYILHKDLELPSPDVKLSAVVRWAMNDPDIRFKYLATIVKTLPLSMMTPWVLQDTLHNPLIRKNQEIFSTLEAALKEQQEDAKMKKSNQAQEQSYLQGSRNSESQEEYCLVIVGHCLYEGDEVQGACDKVTRLRYGKDFWMDTLGKIGASYISDGAKSIIDGKILYIGGLGQGRDELWQFNLDRFSPNSTGSFLCKFTYGRQGHAMCLQKGLIYIIGGFNKKESCTPSIQVLNPRMRSCHTIGNLRYSDILDSDGSINNLTVVADNDDLVVCGAYPNAYQRRAVTYQNTIQIFSIREGRVTSSVILGRVSDRCVYSMVPVATDTFIIFGHDYTAVVKKIHIVHNQPGKCSYSDKYIVPNEWCGVVMTPDKEHILLLGGNPKPGSSPDHFVYRARVHDIIVNSGNGWEQLKAHWPLGRCEMVLSNTVDMVMF